MEEAGGSVNSFEEALEAIDEKVKSQKMKNGLLRNMLSIAMQNHELSEIKELVVEYNEKITDEAIRLDIQSQMVN